MRLNLQVSPLHQVAEQTNAMLTQYRANTQASRRPVISNSNGGNRWRAPQAGFVKVNFDGAVFVDSNKSSVGIIIKDNNGAVLASCSKKKKKKKFRHIRQRR